MYTAALVSIFCVVVVSSAAVQDDRLRRSSLELTNQEEDLKRLADKSFKSSVSVAHSSAHVKNVQVVNGKERVVEQSQDKVFDPMTGELLRRLEQTLEGHREEQGEPLKTQTHTELDVPSQNIHESWSDKSEEEPETSQPDQSEPAVETTNQPEQSAEQVQQSSSEEDKRVAQQEPVESDLSWLSRYTPTQIAEYLSTSGDVTTFLEALRDLQQSGLITMDQAEAYETEVANAYDQLVEEQTSQGYIEEEPEQAEEESPEVYMQLLRNALSRLYREAVIDGDKDAEQTLEEFVDYMSGMVSTGQLPQQEVNDIVGMLGDIVAETPKPKAAEKAVIQDKQEESTTDKQTPQDKSTPESSEAQEKQ